MRRRLWHSIAFVPGRHVARCALLLPLVAGMARGDEAATRPAVAATRPSSTTSPAPRQSRLGPDPPQLEAIDRVDLARLVRQTIEREARREQQAPEPPYTPASLTGVRCRASVTLRLRGRLLGTADSTPLPVMEAVTRAAQEAFKHASIKIIATGAEFDELGLEIELAGEREQVGHAGEDPARLAGLFEPGIHGVAVRVDDKEVLVRPSQLISMETFCIREDELDYRCDRYAIAIGNLREKLGLSGDAPSRPPAGVSVWRFQTTHMYQPAAGAEPVVLIAGLRLVEPAEVTLESIRAAADDVARYLRHRQTPDGLFAYEFLPGRGIYWLDDQNWVRQAGTTWAVAQYARRKGDASAGEAAERAIAALGAMLRPAVEDPHGAYLHTPDSRHPLGAAALYSLALLDSPLAERHADSLGSLITGLELMQLDNGQFRGHFPPSRQEASEDYYPGEALLAIARYYALHPSAERRAICDRAFDYYTRYFRENHVAPFIPWHAQAWGELARTTHLRKYADFVFEMTDYLIAMQLEERELPLAIYDGGIDTTRDGRAGVNTAVYVEGIVDAIRTADAFGEVERAARYREVVRRAMRFVMQLRFREEECYYVPSPQEAVGGMRNTPIEPTLRIDNSQHALAALMGAAEVLTGKEATKRGQ